MLVLFKLTVYCFLKRIKKPSGELIYGRGETTFSWGETTLSWGETTLSWGETDLGRNDRSCEISSFTITAQIFASSLLNFYPASHVG